jgi:hypothetical protein
MAHRSARRDSGIVLVEILLAMVIFATVVLAWHRATDDALEAADAANRDRVLRLLTARKLHEVVARPSAFKAGDEGGFERELVEDEANPYEDYRWSVEAVKVVAAGYDGEDDAEFLFPRDEDGGEPPAPAPGGKTPDPLYLWKMTVRVTWLPDGEEGAEFRVVTFVPYTEQDAKDEL